MFAYGAMFKPSLYRLCAGLFQLDILDTVPRDLYQESNIVRASAL